MLILTIIVKIYTIIFKVLNFGFITFTIIVFISFSLQTSELNDMINFVKKKDVLIGRLGDHHVFEFTG